MNRTKSPFKHNEDGHLLLSEVAHKEAHEGEVDDVVTNDLSVENVSNYSKKKVKEEKVKEVKEEKVKKVKEEKKVKFLGSDTGYTYINKQGETVPVPESGLDATGFPSGQWKGVKKATAETKSIEEQSRLSAEWYENNTFVPEEGVSDIKNNKRRIQQILQKNDNLSLIETNSLKSEYEAIEDKEKIEESSARKTKGKETVNSFNEINLGFPFNLGETEAKLDEKYGYLGFTFNDNVITSIDNQKLEITAETTQEEIKEFMANQAEEFGSRTEAVVHQTTKRGKLSEGQKTNNLIAAQSEVNNSILTQGEGDAFDALAEVYNFEISQANYIQGDMPRAVGDNYIENLAETGSAFTDKIQDSDGKINDNIQGSYRDNLKSAILSVAGEKLNKELIESGEITQPLSGQKLAELYSDRLNSIRSDVSIDYENNTKFMRPEVDKEASGELLNKTSYVAGDIFNEYGENINEDLYAEKLNYLETKDPVYDRLTNIMANQKNTSDVNEEVTNYVENLEVNLLQTPESQAFLQNALPEELEKLDDQQKKLIASQTLIGNNIKAIETEYQQVIDWGKVNSKENIQKKVDAIRLGEDGEPRVFTTQDEVDEANQQIEGIINTYGEEYEANQAKLLDLKSRKDANAIARLDFQIDYEDFKGDKEAFANYANLIDRNYQIGTQSTAAFANSAIDLVQGISYAVEGVSVDLVKELVGSDSGFGDSEKETFTDFVNEAVDNFQQEHLIDNVQIMPSYESIETFADAAEWGTVTLFSQAPQLGMLFAPGGTVLLAASSAGNYYHELDEEAKLFDKTNGVYGNNVGYGTAVMSGVGVGAVNYYSERITLGQIKGVNKILTTPTGRATVGSYLRKNIFNTKSLVNGGIDLFTESTSEGLATIGENAISIMNGGEGGLFDNVEASMVTGGLMSTMIKSPILFKSAFVPFQSVDNKLAIDNNLERTARLGEQLLDNNLIDKHEDIKKEIASISLETTRLIENDIKRVDVLNDSEKTDLLNIESDNRKLKQAASEIIKDESLSKEQKQEQLTQINEKLNKNGVRKQEVLDKYPDDVVKEKYKHTMNSVKDQVKIIKDYGGPEINVQEGNTKKFGEVLEAAGVDPVYQTRYGGLMPVLDNYGKVKSYDMFVNKETSLKDGMFTTGAHELLHGIMYQTLKQDNNTQEVVGDALLEALTDAGATISPDSDFNERINSYTKAEGQGEEIMAITSEALMKGEITLPESALDKLGNVYRRVVKNKTNRDIEFNKPKDVLNFIKDYNYSIEKNMSQPAITRMAAKGITGEMVSKFQAAKKNADAKASFSRNVMQEMTSKPDLKTDFDNLVQDDSGVKKYKTKDSFLESTDFFPAYDMIVNSKKLDGLVMANVSDVIQPDQMSDFVNKVKEKIGDRFLKNFDPSINESLFGWLTGVAGGAGQSIIYRAKGDVMNEYNKVIKAASIDKGRVNAEGDTFASQIEADTDVRIESLDDQVMSPGQETAVKQKQEGRVLENLSEVGLENMGEVDAVVMAEVEALIEQNPKDLDKKLNNLIEKEFRKLVVAGMGKVSRVKVGEEVVKGKKKPIYKVDVSGDYKAFHALEFDNMVKSLSTDVIKNNYNNLFDIEQTSREKDRKVNPVTGKITYPGKGIFTIGTNKAKWTKYFTEGGYTTLKERQNGLAKLIAKSKAKTAVDNYIIENSTDINKVVDAKLNLLSESLDNQQKEITSFDKIQFAKKANSKTDSKKQGLPVKLGSIIEAQKFLETIRKEVDALYATNKFIDKGRAFEQAAINRIKQWKIAGLDVAVEIATEEGGLADVTLRVHTVKGDYGIEMKYGSAKATDVMLSAQSVPWSLEGGRLNSKNNYKGVFDMDSYMKKHTESINDYYNFVNQQIYDYNSGTLADADGNFIGDRLTIPEWKTSSDAIPTFIHQLALKPGADFVNELRSKSTTSVDLYDIASAAYLNKSKPSQAIEFFGEGLLSLNKDNNPFGLPLLQGEAEMGIALSSNTWKKTVNGKKSPNMKYGLEMKTVSPRVIPKPVKITSKAEGSLLDKKYMSNRPAMKLAKIVKQNNEAGEMFSKAVNKSRLTNKDTEIKGITVLDFDDTLATSKSMIRYTTPDGTKGTLNAEQYASTYQELSDQGYKWDFSEFNEVVDGKTAPLFNKALKLQEKFGATDMFVLTARPAEAAPAIFKFLQANGLDIPLKNITGLANSTSEAKALWMADKVGDGYNDFYFADDALQNVQAVQNMLDQFDVKSKVQQAKIQFSKTIDTKFNDILQNTTGVDSKKRFSAAQAKIRGAKGRYKGLVPASAQDFMGLMYNFLGKGKQGDKDMAFFKKALVDPFARGIDELNGAKQSASNDYKNLTKAFPQVKKDLNKKLSSFDNDFQDSNFTVDQAVRVYLWNKAGFDVPGLSARDLKSLVDFVKTDSDLQAFADGVGLISKKADGYSKPSNYWLVENIASDLMSDGSIGDARAEFLGEWQQNADQIFSPENLNKIEAIYGSKFVEALKDSLYRMQTGKNRPQGSSRLMNTYMNWVNNSVGAIMFFNMRSAVLQTISATNYVNWSDNNPLKAAQAFANQKQYWSDFAMIFNSDYLKQRRSGNKRGVNEADLSAAVAGSDNKAKAALAWLLSKGFLPTQIADSFAIASGGASFFRNRVKSLMKQGALRADAESKAFIDFQETTEVSQQSARPDMISQQQANPLGRLILSFQNTPMQYGRIMNKAFRDIASGRGDTKTHMSKIIYYGGLQAIVFGALQSALFASLGDEDEEEFDKKKERILNQMVDSWLSVFGFGGKAVATIKSTIQEFLEQKDKGFNADHAYTILALLGFSPPIGSKARKIYSAIQTDKFNEDVYSKRGFTLDNPIWNAIGNVIEGVTNVPLGRLSNKMLNLDNAMDDTNEWWQRAALLLGWNTWDLGIKDKDIQEVKEVIKEEKKVETKKKRIIKKEEKKKEKEKEEKKVIENNIEKQKKEKKEGKKDIKCAAVSKGGSRCKTTIEPGQSYCTVHEKAEKNESGKKSQCKKVKKDKKRCKMQTNSKSGYCYYHD